MADDDRLVKEVWIDAPPDTVYAYFTDPARLARWMGPVPRLEARPGGDLHIDPNATHRIRGRFLEVVPHTRMVFSWGYEPPGPPILPGATVVEVTFTPETGGTRLRLVHRDLPPTERDGHSRGWDYHLERLRQDAEGLAPDAENCPQP